MAASTNALVGRDTELAVARGLLDGLVDGEPGTLLVEGEAGIGKSRLVQSLVEAAHGRGVTVYSGEAHPFERTRPFGALAHAMGLSRRSPDPRRAAIGRLLVGDSGVSASTPGVTPDYRHRIVEELLDLIERSCADGPVLLSIEDIHWADSSTLLALRSMMHGLGRAPLLVVASFRPAPRTAELDQVLGDALGADASMLRLRLLSSDQVDVVARGELGEPPGPALSAMLAKAGGNPLWVVEIVRSLSTEGLLSHGAGVVEATTTELPDSLRELVVRQLRYLPEPTLELLRVTAVLGDAASVQDLVAVVHQPATEVGAQLSDAFRAGLLGELGDRVVFRHQLVHDAIYRDIPGPVRRALHREIAGALAGAGADPLQVADHLVLGAGRGDLEAVDWLRRAAREAAAGAPTVTVELLRRAESLLPGGHPDADIVAAELVDALLRSGNVAEAAARAEAVLGRRHRDEADWPLQLSLISALSLQNRATELVERAESALTRTPALSLTRRSLMLAQAGYGRIFSGDLVGGEAAARKALVLAERAGSATMTAWSLTTLSVTVRWQGRYAEALALTRRAVDLAVDRVHPGARVRHPLFFLGMALCDSDRFDEARVAYTAALAEYDEIGSMWLTPDTLLISAVARFLIGDWDDAAPEFEAGLQAAHDHGNQTFVAQALTFQAVMALARGDDREAFVGLEPILAGLEQGTLGFGSEMAAVACALLAESRSDPESAYRLLLRFWDHDVERDNRYYHRDLSPPLVRLAMKFGDGEVARRVADAVDAGAALAPEVASVQSAARRCRGLAEQDPDRMVEAVGFARLSPRMIDHARVCEDAADVLIAAGRPGEAKPLLDEALQRYDGIGALAWARRTRATLRRIGVPSGTRGPRRRPAYGWESLTATERDVSELVAEGLTNREVARRFHVSPHTVNTHLRHVFEKLSVANRAELAATVTRNSRRAT